LPCPAGRSVPGRGGPERRRRPRPDGTGRAAASPPGSCPRDGGHRGRASPFGRGGANGAWRFKNDGAASSLDNARTKDDRWSMRDPPYKNTGTESGGYAPLLRQINGERVQRMISNIGRPKVRSRHQDAHAVASNSIRIAVSKGTDHFNKDALALHRLIDNWPKPLGQPRLVIIREDRWHCLDIEIPRSQPQ
jgi:hypothetical protein